MAALVVAFAFASGCGGDSSSNSTSGQLSKAEFIRAGDRTCQNVHNKWLSRIQVLIRDLQKHPTGKTEAEENLQYKAARPALIKALREFKALEGPDDRQSAAIVAALAKGIQQLEANPHLRLTGGPGDPFGGFAKLSGQYGFKVCSEF